MTCCSDGCERPARCAVRATRPTRDDVQVRVWTDDRAAKVPKVAARYCHEHGLRVVQQLMAVLVDGDD